MALDAGKPVVVAESTARDTIITNDSEMAASYWDEWFDLFFTWLNDHEQIKAFHYINVDWTVLGHYGDAGWGQADLTVNPALLNQLIELHWIASATFAFIRSSHKGKQLNGFLRVNGSFASLKHLNGFNDQRSVAIVDADRTFTFGALGGSSVTFAFSKNAGATSFPRANNLDLAVVRGLTHHAFAAFTHHGKKRFAAVHAVPK